MTFQVSRAATAILCVGILTACGEFAEKPTAPGAQASAAQPGTLVLAEPLTSGSVVAAIERTAKIEALHLVDVHPRISGMVTAVHVDVGDPVKTGDLLVDLERETQALDEASSKVAYDEALESIKQAEIDLEEAQDTERTTLAKAQQALKEYERSEHLAKDKLITERELELRTVERDDADAAHRVAGFRARRAETALVQANNRAEAARIAWETDKLDLQRTRVYAAMDGVVCERTVEPGLVISSTQRILQLVDNESLVVNLKISQKDLLQLSLGLQVEVRAREALGDTVFNGSIERMSPVVDPVSGTLTVRVVVEPDPQHLLRPGMFVECRVLTKISDDSLLVARRAVFYEESLPTFFAVRDGIAIKVSFRQGTVTGESVEIIESDHPSLVPGDLVVVIGKDRLQDGDPVQIADLGSVAEAVEAATEDEQAPESTGQR